MASDETLSGVGIVLIGCGKMGSALGSGLVDSGVIDPEHLRLSDRAGDKAQRLADDTGAALVEPEDAFECFSAVERRLFVVAVKPKDVRGVLERARSSLQNTDTVVSIAAGVPTKCLADWAGEAPELVRAMPNTPALVGQGITGVYTPGEADMGVVRRLFRGVGRVVELQAESDFDALTGISGSGPAYVFTAIEALADGAVSMGLDRQVAIDLAVETLLGAAALARSRSAHTAELKDEVTSPGGTTITGLSELERRGFRSALIEAVRSAADKSEEMTEQLLEE